MRPRFDTRLVNDPLFLDADGAHAQRKQHLTARQAGEIARACAATAVTPFHFSPRYTGREAELVAELQAAFVGAVQCVASVTGDEAP